MFYRPLIIALLICFSHMRVSAQAQQIFDSLQQRFASRDSLYASSQLYLHTDKTIYTGSENIWFTAYLLKAVGNLNEYNTVHVVLSHAVTHEVVASNQFVMDEGIAAGNIFIADSFPAGDYNLIAYTNVIGKEYRPGLYQQRVTLRFGGGNPFRVEFDSDKRATDSIRFLARVTNKALLNATGATFSYSIYNNDKAISSNRFAVSPFGEVPIVIPEDSAYTKLELQATIQKEKEKFSTRLPLSFLGDQISIRWYPEGGNWINGLQTRTAFEVMDRSGKPTAVKGQLLQDGKPLLSFQSSSTGVGIIEFIPIEGKRYSVMLDDKDKKLISIIFPEVRSNGVQMQVRQAVVKVLYW